MRAIVLVRRDVREVDQMISVYSEEFGKRELLARGVKKMISKNSPHLEPCTLLDIDVAEGREIDHLIKAQPVEFFAEIRKDFRKSILAFFVLSLVDRAVHTNEPDERLFDLLHGWLLFLRDAQRAKSVYVDGFAVSLLHVLGFTPQLSACAICGKEVFNNQESLLFSIKTGSIACALHEKERYGESDRLFRLDSEGLALLRMLVSGEWDALRDSDIPSELYVPVHRMVYFFLRYHTEKEITDWENIITE